MLFSYSIVCFLLFSLCIAHDIAWSSKRSLFALHPLHNHSTVLVSVDPTTGNVTFISQILPSSKFTTFFIFIFHLFIGFIFYFFASLDPELPSDWAYSSNPITGFFFHLLFFSFYLFYFYFIFYFILF
jgi:hypothetical protein